MSTLSKMMLCCTAGLLLAALPVAAGPIPVLKSTDALIENTGSTNTTGYKIFLSPDGHVAFATTEGGFPTGRGAGYEYATLLKAQTKKLFLDLSAAMPLTSLPARHGMRSASFGTRTTITYKGQQSPDLTFASDPRTVALKADIDAITKTLHIGNAPRRPIVIHADRPIVIHADR